jgi:hypothetical protein
MNKFVRVKTNKIVWQKNCYIFARRKIKKYFVTKKKSQELKTKSDIFVGLKSYLNVFLNLRQKGL